MEELNKDIETAMKKLSQTIREFELDKISSKRFRDLVYGYSKYIKTLTKYGGTDTQKNNSQIINH